MKNLPISVCSQAIGLLEAYRSGKFVDTNKRDAWIVHALDDFSGLCYDGAYVENGWIVFIGDDGYAYRINIEEKWLERT